MSLKNKKQFFEGCRECRELFDNIISEIACANQLGIDVAFPTPMMIDDINAMKGYLQYIQHHLTNNKQEYE